MSLDTLLLSGCQNYQFTHKTQKNSKLSHLRSMNKGMFGIFTWKNDLRFIDYHNQMPMYVSEPLAPLWPFLQPHIQYLFRDVEAVSCAGLILCACGCEVRCIHVCVSFWDLMWNVACQQTSCFSSGQKRQRDTVM